jgi:hypothetical protein
MMITLSKPLRDAIAKAREDAARAGTILEAYKVAKEVQLSLPNDNVAVEDIITALVTNGCFEAVEFNPGQMVLEVVYPLPVDGGERFLQDEPRVAA